MKMIYAALLRGINVGGHNKINMKLLKGTFERIGMKQVTTYINSGNIVFASDPLPTTELAVQLEQAIAADFGLSISVLIRSLSEMERIITTLPDEWSNGDIMKSDVLFLWEEIDDSSVVEQLPLKVDTATVLYTPGAVLVSIPRELVTRSGMNKLVGTRLYAAMTIRNVNTTRQIYKLMQAAAQQDPAEDEN